MANVKTKTTVKDVAKTKTHLGMIGDPSEVAYLLKTKAPQNQSLFLKPY